MLSLDVAAGRKKSKCTSLPALSGAAARMAAPFLRKAAASRIKDEIWFNRSEIWATMTSAAWRVCDVSSRLRVWHHVCSQSDTVGP